MATVQKMATLDDLDFTPKKKIETSRGMVTIQTLSIAERDDVDDASKRGESDADGKSLFDYREFIFKLLEYGMVEPKMTREKFDNFRDDENNFIQTVASEIQYFSGIIKRPEVPEKGPLSEKSGSDTSSAATSGA